MQQLAPPSTEELSHLEDLELIERHKHGDQSATNRLIKKHLPFIQSVARGMQSGVPYGISLDVDDFIQEGSIAFVKCLERFEPEKQKSLRAFSLFRIRGAMQDAMRALDFVSRADRRAGKPTAEIVQGRWDDSSSRLHSFFEPVGTAPTQPIEPDQWEQILKPFSSREKEALKLYYQQGCKLITIADQLRVSEGVVQRMIARCVRFIRQRKETMGLDAGDFF